MRRGIRKKGKIALAWVICATMVFASMSTPFAYASDTPAPIGTVSGFVQYEPTGDSDLTKTLPSTTDFIFFKQGNPNSGSQHSYLWTKEQVSNDDIAKIFEYVKANDPSVQSYGMGDFIYIYGYGDPVAPSPYSVVKTDDGLVVSWPSGKLSHLDYGEYDSEYHITVTKAVTMNGESTDTIKGTFYVSLFSDKALTQIIGTKPVTASTPATFTVTEQGTYYVAETNSAGVLTTAPGTLLGYNLVSIGNDHPDGIVVTAASENDVTITNNFEYNPKGSGPVDVTKELTGNRTTPLQDGEFSFTLVEKTDSSFATEKQGGYNETVTNLADGTIPFSDILYTEAGTYYYTISENIPADAVNGVKDGMTYDQDVINVTMTVADDGQGNLVGTPAYDGGQLFSNSFEKKGSISVTKDVVVLSDDESIKVTYDFYAALFVEQEGQMVRATDVKKLSVVGSQSTTVTFDNLDLDKTYHVFETDVDGNIIQTEDDGTVTTPVIDDWTQILYDNDEVALTPENAEGSATITNVFKTDDFFLYGSITVKKTVTVNDKPTASNRTFYVGLFSDKELTTLVSDVKALKMNGKAKTSVEFMTDKDGNPLLAGDTYYIAETDKNGVAISDPLDQLGCEVEIDKPSVVITEDGVTVNIINKFEYSEENFPLTGDNSNMNLWLFLAMIGVAGVLAPFAFRKRGKANN